MKSKFIPLAILLAGGAQASQAQAPSASGAALYIAKCSVCHQASGVGAPGQFPPLKNRIDKIAASPEGKHYLSALLVYGMVGKIEAAGASYFGYMPGFKTLPDADIAAILTYLSALGDSTPAPAFTAADIAAVRATPVSAPDMAKERQALAQTHPLP